MAIISYSAAATAKAISCSSVYVSTAKIATLCSSSSMFFNSKTALFLGPAITTRKVISSSGKKGLSCNCLFGLGVLELVVIVALVIGPNQLPEVGRTIGNSVTSFQQRGDDLVGDSRNWRRDRGSVVSGDYRYEEYEDDDDEDEEEEDRSLDLLVKLVQNIFKKLSRKARKAVRSVLPISISSQLVAFSVNGVIILTFLWLSKAVLEVFCTLGSVVFASILLIRGVWTGISYLQNNHNHRTDDDDRRAWSGVQPAS